MDYCPELSRLKFQSVLLNPDIKSSSLHYESGNITLELFPDSLLVQYFFEPTMNYNDFSRITYIIKIQYNNEVHPTWKGFMNYDSIHRSFSESEYGAIKLEISSVDKFFKEYFSALPCPEHSSVFANQIYPIHAPWFHNPNCQEDNDLAYFIEDDIFWRKLFGSKCYFVTPPLPLTPGFTNPKRLVNNIPQLFSAAGSAYQDDFLWLRSGYKRFQFLSVFDLFEKSCNAHGWKWRIIPNADNSYTIVMTNRGVAPSTIVDISLSNDSFEYDECYWIYKQLYDYIIIPCGYHLNRSASTQNDGIKMITSMHSPVINESSFFRDIYNENSQYKLTTWFTSDKKYSAKNHLSSDVFDWAEIYYNSDQFDNRTVDRKYIKNDNILTIDAGDHFDDKTVCDLSSLINRHGEVGESQRDLAFTGCCGDMFFIWDLDHPDGTHIMDYNKYSQTPHFWNNFAPLLNTNMKKSYEIDIDKKILNPDTGFRINNKIYAAESVEPDLINESSKIIMTEV